MEQIELIQLTLNEIQRMATIVNIVKTDSRAVIACDETILRINASCEKQLEITRLKLREILEDIANYTNEKNISVGVDCALSQVPFDLIYERTKDKDYD